MDERPSENSAIPGAPGSGGDQRREPAAPEADRSRVRRPWRWLLGAVSIAAVGAGVIFISKRGFRKPE